jgi:hypothetical protein
MPWVARIRSPRPGYGRRMHIWRVAQLIDWHELLGTAAIPSPQPYPVPSPSPYPVPVPVPSPGVPFWHDPSWIGPLAAWFGGLLSGISLILAMVIFRRTRQEGERSQVNLVGIWSWIDSTPGGERLVVAVRNASSLPVREVFIVARWFLAWNRGDSPDDASTAEWLAWLDFGVIPPDETAEDTFDVHDFIEQNMSDPAKVRHPSPLPVGSTSAEGGSWILHVGLSDNAGRYWVVKSGKKPIRPRPYYWWWPPHRKYLSSPEALSAKFISDLEKD